MNQTHGETEPTKHASSASKPMGKDPVCGMEVDQSTAHNHCEYKGKTYYFRSAYCLRIFYSGPAKYSQE